MKRYDIRGKRLLETNDKYYYEDHGIHNMLVYLIASDDTREREFGRLEAIKDNYPKYVISMTPLVQRNDANGIIHLSLREFLTKGL